MDGEGLSVLLTEACEARFLLIEPLPLLSKVMSWIYTKTVCIVPVTLSASPVLMVTCKMGYMTVKQAEENSYP